MAFPTNYVKMTWGGTLAAGQDIWSCGLYLDAGLGNINPIDEAQWAAIGELLPTYAAAVRQLHTDTDTRIPNNVRLEWLKLAYLDVNGSYKAEAHEYIYPSPVGGGMASAYIPQVACVVTLVSEKYKDPGKYNRFYLPAANTTTAGSYKMTATETEGVAASAAAFIEALDQVYSGETGETTWAGTIRPVVASKSYNQIMPVVSLRVGDVLDTQRRRRNKVYENYNEIAVDVVPG